MVAMLVVNIVGLPGAGKTTLANRMRQDDASVWESGEFIRKQKLMTGDKLQYLPQVDAKVHHLMKHPPEENPVMVICGYPRQVYQHYLLQLWAKMYEHTLVTVLVDVSKESAVERLVDRGRADDTEEGITTRVEEQYPVLRDVMEAKTGMYITVNGMSEPAAVQSELYKVLETAFGVKLGGNDGR